MMISILNFATPETTDFMIAGYIVIFSVMFIYIFSLVLRRRKLAQDLKMLEDMDDQSGNP